MKKVFSVILAVFLIILIPLVCFYEKNHRGIQSEYYSPYQSYKVTLSTPDVIDGQSGSGLITISTFDTNAEVFTFRLDDFTDSIKSIVWTGDERRVGFLTAGSRFFIVDLILESFVFDKLLPPATLDGCSIEEIEFNATGDSIRYSIERNGEIIESHSSPVF